MDGSLMAEKAASPKKKMVAIGLAAAIVIIIVGLLSFTTYELEQHYHIFHPGASAATVNNDGVERGPLLMIVLILLYPLLSALGMALVIPLLIYINGAKIALSSPHRCPSHRPISSAVDQISPSQITQPSTVSICCSPRTLARPRC